MKKFMIGLLFIILLSTTLSANAETVVLKSNDYDKPLDPCYEYHDVLVKSNIGILFWWTGTEFIKCSLLDTKFTKSDNLVEWSDIDMSDDVRMKISSQYWANIKHYGNKYIVYDEVYFNPSFIIDKMERIYGPIIKPIYTFDENFNLVNEFQLDKPLTDFEYIDGVYYAETQEYTKLGPQEYESKNILSQIISPPQIISLSLQEAELLKVNQKLFEEFGFEISSFGGKEYSISAVPSNLYGVDVEELFLEILGSLDLEGSHKTPDLIRHRIATSACKAAVKGNQTLSVLEADKLIDELLGLENPYHCPHGRPTIVSMTKYELEKKFKRIV